MLLTDRFVFLHQPKTAGTFVTRMIERLRASVGEPPAEDRDKHGVGAAIPESHRGLPILATVRSPWSRFVSQYLFGWWRERPPVFVDWRAVKREFPRHPELSFADFVRVTNRFYHRTEASARPPASSLGFQSRQLVRFYARDPAATFARIDGRWIAEARWEEEFLPVRFLRQDDLNRELHDALVDLGYDRAAAAFVLEEGRILPRGPRGRRRPDRPWQAYWTGELAEEVRARESLFWAMFPGYGDFTPERRAPSRVPG